MSDRSSPPNPTKWDKGNFTIISSDNYAFKIDDYHLRSASSVFRDMLSAGTGMLQIELTDPTMEDSGTVDIVLDIILNATFADNMIKNVVSAALFLKKYDCAVASKHLAFRLQHAVFAPRVKMFILGAALDDEDLCVTALQHPLSKWSVLSIGTVPPHAESHVASGRQFDTGSWPISWAAATPFKYLWALNRAWTLTKDGTDLAALFRTQLKYAKASPV
ncbi:hypothetical protein Q8F55_002742 [Vanrija albida]|uniref:BTB domain-containing protein n=1 Tax=Vanrija albida TaxID=181172 RepID=A0ABR3QAN7_9TREE